MSNHDLPVGTRDEFGTPAEVKERIQDVLAGLFRDRGFRRIKTPVLEYAEVFGPLRRVDYRPYQMLDDRGDLVVLRPDLTLPVARFMSSAGVEGPACWYYAGDVFRLTRALSGRYNQLTQVGAEVIGYPGLKGDWECIVCALEGCARLGIQRVTVELAHAGFADAVLAALPIPVPSRLAIREALFAKDLSAYERLIAALKDTEWFAFLEEWPWLFGGFSEVMATVGRLPVLPAVAEILEALRRTAGFLADRFPEVQVSLGLNAPTPQSYYTGLAFRGFTAESSDYLFSGGRYDDLMACFQARSEPAVGVAFSVDAIAERLPDAPRRSVLVYYETDQWPEGERTLRETPGAEPCFADSAEAARQIAERRGIGLIDLTITSAPDAGGQTE